MTVALRVVTALNEKRPPDPADIEELRRYAPLAKLAASTDIACDVVQQGVKHRERARSQVELEAKT